MSMADKYTDLAVYYRDNGNKRNNPLKSLYFISDGEFVKIGVAYNAHKRLKALQTGNPRTLKLIASFKNCGLMEWETHNRLFFKSLNVRGEWFRHTEEIDRLITEMELNNG